jgi:hypothetical protein
MGFGRGKFFTMIEYKLIYKGSNGEFLSQLVNIIVTTD